MLLNAKEVSVKHFLQFHNQSSPK